MVYITLRRLSGFRQEVFRDLHRNTQEPLNKQIKMNKLWNVSITVRNERNNTWLLLLLEIRSGCGANRTSDYNYV